MRFIASAVYIFLKGLVFLSTRILYAKFTTINKRFLDFKKPTIIVSNHPSTLLDPLNVGVGIPKQVYFLANAGLFTNPVLGGILNLYCIPIERPKDVGGRRIKNDENFARADQHLTNGRCLYVAPEGTSVVERRIRKVKTGTARIALSAENKNNFNLGLTIVPVGLNYTSPLVFQSEVLVNVGNPIKVSDYQEAYQENPFHAAKKLTADLQDRMESLIFHTDDDEQDGLLKQIETVLKSEKPESAAESFLRTQKILEQLKALDENEFADFKNVGNQYFKGLEKEGTTDLTVARNLKKSTAFLDVLKMVLGLPLFLYGWINNFLGFFIPGFLAKVIKIYPGYKPAVMVMSGLIFIPLFFFVQTKLVSHFIDIPYIGWIYLLTLLPMGWIAWQYRKFVFQYFKDQKVKKIRKQRTATFEALISNRKHFLSMIESITRG